MALSDDLMFRTAGELASLVRSGHLSARELVSVSLERIEALNPALNAFIEVDAERALEAAGDFTRGDSRPFAGVPIAIKGNTPVAGWCTNFASRFLSGHRPEYSAYLVRRLKDAGFVVVGVTNLPEFGILPTTEPRHTGPTRNPWDLTRTPGGSSGGSAAAVASGMLPLAHGHDGGGALRTPASACGLVGLKPSRGRVSSGPDLGDSWLGANGVLTRTVADTAIALDVLGGYEVGDANWAPRPLEPYVTAMRRSPGRLRVAVTATNPFDASVDQEAIHGLRVGAELLSALGHEVVEAAPAWPTPESLSVFISVFGPAIALAIDAAVRRRGREPDEDEIEPLSRVLYERSKSTPAVAYLGAVAQMQAIARGLVAFFADYDILMTPGLAERPLKIGECNGLGADPMRDLERSGLFTPYTSLFNVTGQPAISIPVGFGADGLPTNVQLVGKPLNEDRLLQVALQMEAAHPWAHQRPSLEQNLSDAAG